MTQPEQLMTIGEMAARLAEVDGTYTAAYLARQMRALVQHGVLVPRHYHGEGRTAAAMFGLEDLCHARLLGVLARMGVAMDTLASVRACMNNMDRAALLRAGVEVDRRMESVIARLKAGERWFFVAHIVHSDGLDADVGSVRAGLFTPTPDFTNRLTQNLSGVAVVLDCMTLIGPLVMDHEEFDRARVTVQAVAGGEE